jgi:hypothetical protein
MVFQHGSTHEDFLLAHILAVNANPPTILLPTNAFALAFLSIIPSGARNLLLARAASARSYFPPLTKL